MSSQILPRRMNAMSIQQVAAAEEFATQVSDQDRSLPESQSSKLPAQNPPPKQIAADLSESIQQSLESVGSGIQALLAESLTLATGDVRSELRNNVQQQVQEAIRKSLPSLSQHIQKEARKVAAAQADQVAKKIKASCLAEITAISTQQEDTQQQALDSISSRIDEVVTQHAALQRTNEEQRKVIVALVRKVGALENHATATSRHHHKTDQRLKHLEQPADLDDEWKDLLSNKEKANARESDSAA